MGPCLVNGGRLCLDGLVHLPEQQAVHLMASHAAHALGERQPLHDLLTRPQLSCSTTWDFCMNTHPPQTMTTLLLNVLNVPVECVFWDMRK